MDEEAIMGVFDKLNPNFAKGRAFGSRLFGSSGKRKTKEFEDIDTKDKNRTMPELFPTRETSALDLGKIKSARKGGRVKKDGVFVLHKGEFVIPARKANKRKASREAGRR